MKKALATFALVIFGTIIGRADVILSWDVSGQPGSQATQTAGTINGVSGGVLSRVTVTPSTAANSFNSTNWNTSTFDATTKYLSFTLQPLAGNTISLTDLQFAINGSNSAPASGLWGYSIDGGSFVLGTSGDGGAFTITQPQPGGLATWDFTNFSVTSSDTVEFRFWAFGSTSINGGTSTTGGAVRIANVSGNDLVVNGTITSAIPEPATLGLIGLGLLGTWAFGYRCRRNK